VCLAPESSASCSILGWLPPRSAAGRRLFCYEENLSSRPLPLDVSQLDPEG